MKKEDGTDSRERRETSIRDTLVFRSQEWSDDGFDTTELVDTIRNEKDLRKVKKIFKDFKMKVRAMKDVELDLLLLETTGLEDEVTKVKDRIRDLSAIDDLKEAVTRLKIKAENLKGQRAEKKLSEKDQLLAKVKEWSKQRYNVKAFEKLISTEHDISKLRTVMAGLEKKIKVLEKVKRLMEELESDGLEADVRRIDKMVRNLERVDHIWKEVYALREKIKDRKKVVVQAEATSRPVKVKVKRKVVERPETEGVPSKEKEELVQFRRIDVYVQLLQNILLANRMILTLDTLRLAQRALKKDYPKIMFFLIQKDFKIKSMMPDHPDSYRALEAFLNKLHTSLSGLIGEGEAKERMRRPAKEYIMAHIQEILASGLDDYFPVFLIIDDNDMPEERPEAEVEEDGTSWEDMIFKVQVWEEEGYKIDRLIQAMDGNKELAVALFRKTEEEIFWLKELEKDVAALEGKGCVEECKKLRKKLRYPERISEIEDDILSAQMMIDMGESLDDGDLI